MCNYGSELIDWWNKAFHEMQQDGSFREVCVKAIREHGEISTNQTSNQLLWIKLGRRGLNFAVTTGSAKN